MAFSPNIFPNDPPDPIVLQAVRVSVSVLDASLIRAKGLILDADPVAIAKGYGPDLGKPILGFGFGGIEPGLEIRVPFFDFFAFCCEIVYDDHLVAGSLFKHRDVIVIPAMCEWHDASAISIEDFRNLFGDPFWLHQVPWYDTGLPYFDQFKETGWIGKTFGSLTKGKQVLNTHISKKYFWKVSREVNKNRS